jgi:DNA replication protein DnaC
MNTPHIKTIGTTQYHLGKIANNVIEYDFNKIKTYLNAKGKMMFGKKFKLYPEDESLIYKLCSYFINDHQTCAKFGIDTNKGLLLSGPVGCGKTSLMKLLPQIMPYKTPFEVVPTRNIIFEFNAKGYDVLTPYNQNEVFCFDDLGIESTGCHYGKDCNVMGEILLSRYDLFMQTSLNRRTLTHITTNLNAKELEERYGSRLRSRLRESYNLIGFNKNSKDKRN